MEKFSSAVLRYRSLVVSLCVVLTLFFAWQIKDLKINSDVTTYLPEDDPAVSLFKYIGETYAMSWTAIIIVESDEVFSVPTIESINEITQELRYVNGVDFVTSLTNIMDIRKTEDGFDINRLIDEYYLPQTPEEAKDIKSYTMARDMYKGRIVSGNTRYALVMCQIDEDYDKNMVASEIREAIKSLNLPENIYFEGMPFQVQSVLEGIVDDLIFLTPMIVVIILLCLYLSFKSFRGVLLPILAVSMGIVWTMGLMSLFKVELTPISNALPVVLFAVGSAYGIHVINKIKSTVTLNERKTEQLTKAMSEISPAVAYAGVTTFVGFMSFIFSTYLHIVSDFGIFAAFGVLFILILSITFIPAFLSFFPVKQAKSTDAKVKKSTLDTLLVKLSYTVVKKKKAIFAAGIIIMLAATIGIPFIERKVDILEYFKPNSEIRQTAALMNKEFGGSLPIQILVNGDIQSPDVMRTIKDITVFLDEMDDVSNARSIAQYIEEMNDAMGDGKQIPDSRSKIANLWFMIEGEDVITQMVNRHKDEAVIYANMQNVDAKRVHEIEAGINAYISNLETPDMSFGITGMQSVYAKLDASMMNNLIQSMILAFVFIFIAMIFLIGSVKGAFVGMLTLFFSIVFVFGFMGFTGIALDIATILIAGITVGIGIDYSIHFVTAYKNYILKGLDVDEAITNTIQTTGRAISINVFTIICGFLVLLFANLIPLQQFGILVAVTMFCSGFGAITLMPAVISLFKIKIIKIKFNNSLLKNGGK